MARSERSLSSSAALIVSVGGFVVVLACAVAYIAYAGQLNFIPDWLYYLVLLVAGLAAATFLHRVLRSHAKLTGKLSYGTVELTGPSVVALLVVVGGFTLAKRDTTFALTVRVHGPGGPADIVREGSVTLDLGQDRRTAAVGPDGRVVFAEVPSIRAGERIRIIPEVPGFEAESDTAIAIPPHRVIDLALARRTYATSVRGTVTDARNRVVPNALVSFNAGAASTATDSAGRFSLTVPMAAGSVVPVTVTVDGQVVYDNNVTVAEQPALRLRIR